MKIDVQHHYDSWNRKLSPTNPPIHELSLLNYCTENKAWRVLALEYANNKSKFWTLVLLFSTRILAQVFFFFPKITKKEINFIHKCTQSLLRHSYEITSMHSESTSKISWGSNITNKKCSKWLSNLGKNQLSLAI